MCIFPFQYIQPSQESNPFITADLACGKAMNDGLAKRQLRSALAEFSEVINRELFHDMSSFDVTRLLDLHSFYGHEFSDRIPISHFDPDIPPFDLSHVLGDNMCSQLTVPPDMQRIFLVNRSNHLLCSLHGTGKVFKINFYEFFRVVCG